MKTATLFLTLALVLSASTAQAADALKKFKNENAVAFMDYKCSLKESAKQLIFADADVDVLAMGMMLNTRERVLSVRMTARTGTKQSSDLLLFLKTISGGVDKMSYSFDSKLGAVLAIEELTSNEGRTRTLKIQMTEESGTTETTVVCSAALIGN